MKSVTEYVKGLFGWCETHASLLIGVAAIFFGLIFAYLSRDIFVNLIMLACGLFLIYYGLLKLKVTKVTDFVDRWISKIKR